MKHNLLFCGLILAAAISPARSEVKLPAVIGSNMVLQRNTDARLWGTAKPGSTVEITGSWTDKKVTTKADKEGKWATTIPTTEAGGPYTMTFSDGQGAPTQLTGVLLGEVWICSGQSNMEMPVGGYMCQPVEGGNQAALDAPLYPDIRMFTVPRRLSDTPAQACDNVWLTSTPLTVRTFSAAAYFFGRELNKMLGVPVGLITANWGGTPIESWMSKESLESVPTRNKELAAKRQGQEAPMVLFENMIRPIAPFTAQGFIWYQGESNRDNWYDYADLQVAMVNDWRSLWQNEDMPFYITAIAPYRYEGDEKRSKAMLVEQQYMAADRLKNCGVAETLDIGERQLIHPAGKEKGSKRLAWMALQDKYGVEGLPQRAPRFKSFEKKDDGHLFVSFTNLCGENNFTMGDPTQSDSFNCWKAPEGFEVAGADKVFHKAKAKHHWWKNVIEVWCDEVPDPVAVRYAFQNWSGGNVMTMAEQPLVPFRSDDWEITDIW